MYSSSSTTSTVPSLIPTVNRDNLGASSQRLQTPLRDSVSHVSRRLAVGLTLAVAAVLLPACGGSSQPVRRIAILRAAAPSASESALFDGLKRGGIDRKHVRIVYGPALDLSPYLGRRITRPLLEEVTACFMREVAALDPRRRKTP